jgi:hypothetical protein
MFKRKFYELNLYRERVTWRDNPTSGLSFKDIAVINTWRASRNTTSNGTAKGYGALGLLTVGEWLALRDQRWNVAAIIHNPSSGRIMAMSGIGSESEARTLSQEMCSSEAPCKVEVVKEGCLAWATFAGSKRPPSIAKRYNARVSERDAIDDCKEAAGPNGDCRNGAVVCAGADQQAVFADQTAPVSTPPNRLKAPSPNRAKQP